MSLPLLIIFILVTGITQSLAQAYDIPASQSDRTAKETSKPIYSIDSRKPDAHMSPKDADEDDLLQEFLLAETVRVQKANELQITIGTACFRSSKTSLWRAPLLIEYGVTNRLQIEAEAPLLYSKGFEEADDIEVSIAYALAKNLKSLALTAGLGVVSTAGDTEDETGQQKLHMEPFLILGRKIDRGEVHAHFSKTLADGGEFNFNVAGVYPWQDWRYTLEFNGVAGDEIQIFLTPGIFRRIRGQEFGVGFPIGLTRDAPRIGVVFKATFEFDF
jgi:hypothetical protein